MVKEVFEVAYQRRDNLATAPFIAYSPEYAGEMVRVLMDSRSNTVASVTVTRRPPMPGEVPNA